MDSSIPSACVPLWQGTAKQMQRNVGLVPLVSEAITDHRRILLAENAAIPMFA